MITPNIGDIKVPTQWPTYLYIVIRVVLSLLLSTCVAALSFVVLYFWPDNSTFAVCQIFASYLVGAELIVIGLADAFMTIRKSTLLVCDYVKLLSQLLIFEGLITATVFIMFVLVMDCGVKVT